MSLSHPLGRVSRMRITELFNRKRVVEAPACCRVHGTEHCHGTLVLHADGSVECEHAEACGLDELQHELWVACDEIGCSCAGDDAPIDAWALPFAA